VQIFVDSFVRPGCTHLTFVAMLCPADRERLHREGAQGFAKHLLERAGWLGAGPSSGGQAWASDMLVGAGLSVLAGADLVPKLRKLASKCWAGEEGMLPVLLHGSLCRLLAGCWGRRMRGRRGRR
jgi:hypothetical protein